MVKLKNKQPNRLKSRKEKRKEKRQAKSINRKIHQENYKKFKANTKQNLTGKPKVTEQQNPKEKKFEDDEILSDFSLDDEYSFHQKQDSQFQLKSNKRDRSVLEDYELQDKRLKSSKPIQFISTAEELWKQEKQKQKILQKEMEKERKKQLANANEEDEKMIKSLEKKLKINKKSKSTVPTIFNDGLDDLLELCLPDKMEKIYKEHKKGKNVLASTDSDQNTDIDSDKEDEFSEINNYSDSNDQSDDLMYNSEEDDSDNENSFLKKSWRETVTNIDLGGNESNDGSESENEKNESDKKALKTDIYGRTFDHKGNLVQENSNKYIPPHLKNKLPNDNEKTQRLKRQLKGQINRLTEINLPKISKEIDNMYMHNSRHDMNATLTILILEVLVGKVISLERIVLEHILLIAVLHVNIGSEVGAHFLENVVEKFDEMVKNVETTDVEDKHLDNLVQIICYLYTFKIISQKLVIEIVDKLILTFCEKSVECILIILRLIGFTLRKDDPIALKDLIITIQNQANSSTLKDVNNLRLKFMLETLLAIKNNNMKKIPQYDPTLSEHLKKTLKHLSLNGKYVTTLNIKLSDLLNVRERGKWWVVGSVWNGSETIANPGGMATSHEIDTKESFSENLLSLAKLQRMNTDEKKFIFCTIMSSEDYSDCFEKLMHLNIKDNNILFSIIIHCCISEKEYNPFYSILAQRFCDFNRKYQLALKFSCWDKINNINNFSLKQITNFAKFLIYILQQGGLPLSVLKVIEFSELDKNSLHFMKTIMLGILLSNDEQFLQIFNRIVPSAKLNTFKDSIRLFMNHFFLKSLKKHKLKSEENLLIHKRIKQGDGLLALTKSNIL